KRGDRAIVDPAPRGKRQTIQRHRLERCDKPSSRDPVRLTVAALEQMRSCRLDPTRVNCRHHPCIQSGCLDEAARNNPFRWLGGKWSPGCDIETNYSRPVII